MRTGTLLGSILVFSILLFSLHMGTSPTLATIEERDVSTPSEYVTHPPIQITSDDDFEVQGWPGNGTSENPYLIEGLNITADAGCISITDTRVYFKIKSCLIIAFGSSYRTGIYLGNAPHGAVQDCIVDTNHRGIYLSYSSGCTLGNNTVSGSNFGIRLYSSERCMLTGNTVASEGSGLSVYRADNNVFMNNTINSKSPEAGFWLVDSDNCTLANNVFVDSGLIIDGDYLHYWLQDIIGNSVNGKLLGYFKSVCNMSIDGSHYGQVILANCTNVTVMNGTFVSSSVGIQLGYCRSCTLSENTATKNVCGFHVYASAYCALTHNMATNNSWCDFLLEYSSYCTFTNNIATDSGENGFHLNRPYSCYLANNIAIGNSRRGFYLWDGSDECTFVNNTAANNSVCGFYLSGRRHTLTSNTATDNTGNGFYVEGWRATLTHNIANNNSGSGFHVYVDTCTMTYNTATNNSQYGIYLGAAAHGCILYQNHIGFNGVSNARDDGSSNQWDDGVLAGNYWSDYDGLWSYAIPGDAGSVDRCPFDFGASSTALSQRLLVPIFFIGFGLAIFLLEIVYVYSRRQQRPVTR